MPKPRNSRPATPLTAERLREVLHYDPATGVFTWKVCLAPRGPVGAIAGCVSGHIKYVLIRIDGKLHYAHRLAWFYMTGEWPADQIDHRDCSRANNAWTNLRAATNAENRRNRGRDRRNRGQYKGTSLYARDGVWVAQIGAAGKHYYLGRFKTAEAAHAAYAEAARRLHGEFARAA